MKRHQDSRTATFSYCRLLISTLRQPPLIYQRPPKFHPTHSNSENNEVDSNMDNFHLLNLSLPEFRWGLNFNLPGIVSRQRTYNKGIDNNLGGGCALYLGRLLDPPLPLGITTTSRLTLLILAIRKTIYIDRFRILFNRRPPSTLSGARVVLAPHCFLIQVTNLVKTDPWGTLNLFYQINYVSLIYFIAR